MIRLFSFRLAWIFAAGAVVIPARQVTAAITKEFDETFAVSPEHRLVVDAVQVELTITATDREDIALHMVWNAQTDDQDKATERFERLVFEPKVSDSVTVLKVRSEKKRHRWWNWGRNRMMPNVLMQLQVPKALNIEVDVTSGEVVLRGVRGNHTIETTSADILIEDCAGNHHTDTTSGDIVLRGCPGNHRAESTSGDVRIEGGYGDVKAETTSGDIHILHFPGLHRAESVSGDIQATLASVIDHPLHFETVSGDIVIQIPAALAARFELETVSGQIRFDVPDAQILRKERREWSARTLEGDELIFLDTVSGNITVKAGSSAREI